MTEADWLTCTDPQRMLPFIRAERLLDDRKLRLFGCGCCRLIWDVFGMRRSQEAVVVAERFADALPGGEKLPMAHRAAWAAVQDTRHDRAANRAARAAHHVSLLASNRPLLERVEDAARLCAEALQLAHTDLQAWSKARVDQADLLRELLGNPFQPVGLVPDWLAANDGAVVRLARTLRDEGNFDEVPILGDALEDAGCTDRRLIDHCHAGGAHFRGCWVVDLILGRG